MDAGEVVSDRQLVADLIRTTEKAMAANKRLLDVLYAERDKHVYEVEGEAVQPGDEYRMFGSWIRVVGVGPCEKDGCRLIALEGATSPVHVERFDLVTVRRGWPRGERAA